MVAFNIFKYLFLFIYYGSQLWHAGSYIFILACRTQFLNQEQNLGPMHWECGLLAAGSPGETLYLTFRVLLSCMFCVHIYIRLLRSQLWHVGSWLPHVGSSVVVHGLQLWSVGTRNCGMQSQLLCSMWDFSSQTRDQTCVPYISRQILNHWTTREVPCTYF